MSLKVLMSSKALILLVTLIPMAVSDKLGNPCHTARERVSINPSKRAAPTDQVTLK